LKNQFYEYINDRSEHDKIENIFKNLEVIGNSIAKLQTFQNETEEREKRRVNIDTSKFIQNETFNEYIVTINKYFDLTKKEFADIRSDIEEIESKTIGTKASLKDLKTLEDNILKKLESFKDAITEKFVDKNMLKKKAEKIGVQTKQYIEENNKKLEKMDKWLLSKKLIGGHLCASCENYIGDLVDTSNSKYIFWNKFSQKEPGEKGSKINCGISKILQLINSNKMNTSTINSKHNNSKENYSPKKRSSEKESKSPKTRNNQELKLELSQNKKDFSGEEAENNNNNLPIISMTMRKNNSAKNLLDIEFSKKNMNHSINLNYKLKKNEQNKNISFGKKLESKFQINKPEGAKNEESFGPIIMKILKK
jgi:hypothetical protein